MSRTDSPIQAIYTVEIKGIHSWDGVECMRRILQVYVDDMASCFGVSIGVELGDWKFEIPRLQRKGTGEICSWCMHSVYAHNRKGCSRKDCECDRPRGFRDGSGLHSSTMPVQGLRLSGKGPHNEG